MTQEPDVWGIEYLWEDGSCGVVRGLGPYKSAATAASAIRAMGRNPRSYRPVALYRAQQSDAQAGRPARVLCGECRFFDKFDADVFGDPVGWCTRFPPVLRQPITSNQDDADDWKQPVARAGGTCGEGRPL